VHFIYTIILLTLIGTNLSQAQNYLWPTNASPYLSSSFCEYRPGHYHSAIDIKTWNREGYKCFAVADGKIDHIKISTFGGGKALYLRLNDGRIAVYFHLSRFPKSIDREIRKVQLAQKKYRVEWWPKNHFVKKGQVVAYTGQSGIGVPHLHFEIRDRGNHPLNPLQFYPAVKDAIAPSLQELLIIPQNEKSRSGFSFTPQRIKLIRQKGKHYTLAKPIYASGLIGLALRGFDRANDVANKLNFYLARLLVDAKPIFRMAYDRLSFSKTALANVEVYYPERVRSGKQFHKLYIDSYNSLGFYDRSLGNGLISVTGKILNINITIEDFKGNTSTIEGQIIPSGPQPGRLEQITRVGSNAYLRLALPDSLKSIQFASGKYSSQLVLVNYFEIIERGKSPMGTSALIKVRLNSPADQLLKISYQNGMQPPVTSISQLDEQTPSESKPSIKLTNAGKNVVLQLGNLSQTSDVHLFAGDDSSFAERPLPLINNRSELVVPARDIHGPWRFYITRSDSVLFDSLLSFTPLYPDSSQSFTFFHDSITVASNHAPYDTTLFSLKKYQADSTVYALPVSGPVYDFSPQNRILKKRIKIGFKSDPTFMNGQHTAIYSLDNKNHLHFNGGTYDSLSQYITLHTKSFGRYIIAADTVPPLIKTISPKASKSYKRFPGIRFSVIDNISGIGRPENITVYLDDKFIISEWDPERKLVTARPDYTPKRGPHTIRIEVRDQADNLTRQQVFFKLK